MLGCSRNYEIQLHWRRGERVYASTIDGVAKVEWGRRLCETSEAIATIGKRRAGAECCSLLGRAAPWVHEMSVYRDRELVWQGPLTNVRERRGEFQLTANDVSVWLARRWVQKNYDEGSKDISEHARMLIDDSIGNDDENVEAFLTVRETGIEESWSAKRFEKYALDELGDIADMGLDWTATGRRLLIGPEADVHTLPQERLSNSDFLADLEIEVNGMSAATDVVAVGKDGVYGRVGGWTPTWDRLQTIVSVQDETSTSKLRKIASTYQRQAQPPLTILRVPDGAALNPRSRVSIRQLVCGEKFVITAADFCRPVRVGMRLAQLKCDWSAGTGSSGGGEKVAVSFTPLRGDELEGEPESGA